MFYMIKVNGVYFPRLFYFLEEGYDFGAHMHEKELSFREKQFLEENHYEFFEVVPVKIVEEVKSNENL